jgi:HlyD family secretion protein
MSPEKKKSPKRFRRIAGAVALLAALVLVVLAIRPSPVPVDIGEVTRGPLELTIDEEARTRVHDMYVVSAPITGRVLRIETHAGDVVAAGETILARLLPSDPDFLDVRTREQAEAELRSAQAALGFASAEVERARANHDFARAEVARGRALADQDLRSKADLERLERDLAAAHAALQTAKADVMVRQAQIETARARLIDPSELDSQGEMPGVVTVRAPVDGQLLRVLQQSETVVRSGTPLVEIGDPRRDLEVIVELLSADAVRTTPGDPVMIEDWGGEGTLRGVVERIEPFGFTKVSALGVEEQRVRVIIELQDEPDRRAALGHGFRVEARIVIWRGDDVVRVPAAALFRHAGEWAVFAIRDGVAERRGLRVDHNNGEWAEVLEGLEAGQGVVLYPSDSIFDGVSVQLREAR